MLKNPGENSEKYLQAQATLDFLSLLLPYLVNKKTMENVCMSKYFVVPHNMKPCDGYHTFSQSSKDIPPVFYGI